MRNYQSKRNLEKNWFMEWEIKERENPNNIIDSSSIMVWGVDQIDARNRVYQVLENEGYREGDNSPYTINVSAKGHGYLSP